MSKYKNLLNNSIIFAIGSFGSKFISFFMVPLYTYALSTNDYGVVDLMTTSINLLLPFVTLSIEQAVIRFVMNKTNIRQDREIISTSFYFVLAVATSVSVLGILFTYFTNMLKGYSILFFIFLIVSSIQTVFAQYSRGIKKIKEFAINGIIQTVIIASLNVLLLLYFNMGIRGYIVSLIVSNLISIIYLYYIVEGYKKISVKLIDYKSLRKMLVYSVPLIPNYTMWWLVNNSTRYIILVFIGASGNGLFAVANKIPSIITMFTNVFSQAWQISAFEEYESEGKSLFYSNVFEYYYEMLFVFSSFIVIICKPLIFYTVSNDFRASWIIIPSLCLAVIYQTLSAFVGSIYTASMNTKGVFYTSILGAVISVVINFLTIPHFGIDSAGLGPIVGFAVMTFIRLRDTREFVKIKINYIKFISNNIIFILQIITSFFLFNGKTSLLVLLQSFFFLMILFINVDIFKQMLKYFKKVNN